MEFVRCIFRCNVFLGQFRLKMRFSAQNTQLPDVLYRLLRPARSTAAAQRKVYRPSSRDLGGSTERNLLGASSGLLCS